MDKKEQEFLTQKPTRSKRRDEDKKDTLLNIMIGVVSVGIVIALVIIFTSDDDTKPEQAEQVEPIQPVEEQTVPSLSEEEDSPIETPEDEEVASQEDTVVQSDDATVTEIWTNDSWTPYPTEQTGAHESTYQIGHIDYEEKLKAFYSVIPLEQGRSIVWTVKNNGSTASAIAVLVSNDKQDIYRVAIEWIDGEGWLPVQVEVLNTLP